MFDSLFPKHWTTLQRLMWLKTNALARAVYETITGNPVSFTAKAAPLRKLKVAFSPAQDLHGYDAPWPAGGGKNLLDTSSFASGSYNSVTLTRNADGTISLSGTASSTINLNGTPFTLPAGTYTLSGSISNNQLYLYDKGTNTVIVESVNGATRTVTTTEDKTAYLRLRVGGESTVSGTVKPQLELGSTPTAFSPYSNLCPISGWSEVTVEQRGANLISVTDATNTYNANKGYFTLTYAENAVKFTPTLAGALSAVWKAFVVTPQMAGQKITFSRNITGGGCVLVRSDTADGELNNSGTVIVNGEGTYTITQSAVGRAIGIRWSNGTGQEQTLSDVMLNFGETALPYVPYNGRSISISLGQTVYSGWVDVVTGVGEVDKAYRLLNDAGKWGNSSGTTDYFYNEECADRKLFPSSYTGVICSYVQIREQSGVAYGRWQAATGYRFGIKENGTGLTLDDVKAAATAGKIAICYELAEPIPIQLTPQEVQSLAGDNTMWSDANGDLTVEYRSN